MSEPERIERAATRHEGAVWHLPAPARHHDVFREMERYGFTRWGEEETGFWTSAYRYVDRLEAAQIAKAAGQIIDPQWPPDLYSEDLW